MTKVFNYGDIVCSMQGHDKGNFYLVLGYQQNKVLLVNGVSKKYKNPKIKNAIHISMPMGKDDEIADKLKNKQKINDQMIYHALYRFKKSVKEIK